MTLEEPNKLDIIARSKDKKKIYLEIVDAGVTKDPEKRYGSLIQKLANYVGYTMSNEFKKDFPNNKPADVIIRVACASEPTDKMKQVVQVGPPGYLTKDPKSGIKVEFVRFEFKG
ncbi:hypothetical protein J4214_05095 [Candidatus Woesearchaeota archaeon]|nr:hypothetical protein [Candidatus Woesearchaeota archaeon]